MRALACLIALIGVALLAPGPFALGAAPLRPAADLATVRQQVLARSNEHRAQHGLAPLTLDSRLNAAAEFHTNWMLAHLCFDHVCPGEPNQQQRLSNVGYPSAISGENLALGSSTADTAVDLWFNEVPPNNIHRQNLLDERFRGVGIAWSDGCLIGYCTVWTAVFGVESDGQGDGSGTATPIASATATATGTKDSGSTTPTASPTATPTVTPTATGGAGGGSGTATSTATATATAGGGEGSETATATATEEAGDGTETATPTYTPTPIGSPAWFAYLPSVVRVSQAGW